MPSAEEVLKFLQKHPSNGIGLNLFPQTFKQKKEIDERPPVSEILYLSNLDEMSNFQRSQIQLQAKKRIPIDRLEA